MNPTFLRRAPSATVSFRLQRSMTFTTPYSALNGFAANSDFESFYTDDSNLVVGLSQSNNCLRSLLCYGEVALHALCFQLVDECLGSVSQKYPGHQASTLL